MVIIRLQGGLGNQMFQYAAAKNLILAKNKQLYLDVSAYQQDPQRNLYLNLFTSIKEPVITLNKTTQHRLRFVKSLYNQLNGLPSEVSEKYYQEADDDFNRYKSLAHLNSDIIYLQGFFQSENYFLAYQEYLPLWFNYILPSCYMDVLTKMERSESVAVHFRRGDYVEKDSAVRFYASYSMAYYQESIDIIRSKTSDPLFLFFFSDRMDWVKEHIQNMGYPVVYMDNWGGSSPV